MLACENQTAFEVKWEFHLKGNSICDKTNFIHITLPQEDNIDLTTAKGTGLLSESWATVLSDSQRLKSWNPFACAVVHGDLTALALGLLLFLCTNSQRLINELAALFFLFLSFIWASCSQFRPHLGDIGRVFVPWLALRWGIYTDASAWIRCLKPRQEKTSDLSKNGFWVVFLSKKDRRSLILAKVRAHQETIQRFKVKERIHFKGDEDDEYKSLQLGQIWQERNISAHEVKEI